MPRPKINNPDKFRSRLLYHPSAGVNKPTSPNRCADVETVSNERTSPHHTEIYSLQKHLSRVPLSEELLREKATRRNDQESFDQCILWFSTYRARAAHTEPPASVREETFAEFRQRKVYWIKVADRLQERTDWNQRETAQRHCNFLFWPFVCFTFGHLPHFVSCRQSKISFVFTAQTWERESEKANQRISQNVKLFFREEWPNQIIMIIIIATSVNYMQSHVSKKKEPEMVLAWVNTMQTKQP